MKRKMAHLVSKECAASACPNCSHELSGVTGARIGDFFDKPLSLKGNPTMCACCGALLIFADDAGRVRAMTEAERNSVRFAPIVEQFYAMWREKARPAGDYTKTRFN
jgi:hypothetical protein